MVVIEVDNVSIELIESKKSLKSHQHLVQSALKSTIKIEEKLHVIAVISNVCSFKRRWQLMREFMERMSKNPDVILYIVELAYGDQEFQIADSNNPNHLCLRTPFALWHKENMINLAVKNLLPKDWQAFAWIDADIEFESVTWAEDTLKLLTQFDLVQLFTVCFDLDENEVPMNMWQSYGYKYCRGEKFKHTKGVNYWHSGYAWATTRTFYESINSKLYEWGIVGSGDYIMTQGFVGNTACGNKVLTGFAKHIENYNSFLKPNIKIGYLPCNIRHYFHGSKANRKYVERNQILIKHNYDPNIHLTYDENGLLVPSTEMTMEFINDILNYFSERNEDEYYEITCQTKEN